MDRQFAEWDLFPVALVLGVIMLLILTLDGGEEPAQAVDPNPIVAPAGETEGK